MMNDARPSHRRLHPSASFRTTKRKDIRSSVHRNTMTTSRFTITLITFALLCGAQAYAQAPRTISFQGVLADQNGTLIQDGNHQLKLILYPSASGGSAVFSETQTVAVVKGLFNAIIGSVTPLPASLAFDKAYFLGVTVDNGAELVPRTALTAMPYAIHAETADVAKAVAPGATGIVTSVNNQSGAISLQGGGGTTVTNTGGTFTISSVGGGGTGIQGVQNSDGTLSILNPNGPVAALSVADNAIGEAKLKDNAVGTSKLKDGAVFPTKISPVGAQAGQVLSYNGSTVGWATPSSGGSGITTIQSQDGSITAQPPNGPAVNLSLADGAVTPAKINHTGAGTGQVLTYDGVNVSWGNVSGGAGLTLPYTGNANLPTPAFSVENASGAAGNFTSNGYPAVYGTSSGFGDAIVGFVGTGKGSGVYGRATGAGTGVTGKNEGSGHAVAGLASGDAGSAGQFSISNPANSFAAVNAISTGTGDGILGTSAKHNGVAGISHSAADNGVFGTNDAGGNGVMGRLTGPGNALVGLTLGSGRAGSFTIDNTGNANAAVEASTNGTGDGILGHSAAHNGVAGLSTSATENGVFGGNDAGGNGVMGRCVGAGNAVLGFNGGTGRAGYFVIGNTGSSAAALAAEHSGAGVVVNSVSTGSGPAGWFSITNTGSVADALHVETIGQGHAASIGIPNGSAASALRVYNGGLGIALEASSSLGISGRFDNTNPSNSNPVLSVTNNAGSPTIYSSTTGNGLAGFFRNTNSSSVADVIYASTNGIGDVLAINHSGASGNLVVFTSGGLTKARIDKTGKGFFNGGTQSSGADLAEAFAVEGQASSYAPGDVLVISTTHASTVEKASVPYSTLVAGVYATKPGVLLTEESIDASLEGTVPMGVVGVIPTNVCLENGPIAIGDLLVTSSTPGRAMKADPEKLRVGMALGKALEVYDGHGAARIKVLVNVK
jgi:trimeric autotransporter adhesin